MGREAAIIIPFYKTELTSYESISLHRCFEVFSKEKIIAIKPCSLEFSRITSKYGFFEVIEFEDRFFKDISGYNELMLSAALYQAFLDYKYILIYQLDCFVFKNELDYWCNKGYDYVGAPWLLESGKHDLYSYISVYIRRMIHIKLNLKQNGTNLPTFTQFENNVGNGGFSLRMVSKFYTLALEFKNTIDFYNSQDHYLFNEDSFWAVEVNRKRKRLKIPDYVTSAHFSFENYPEQAIRLTKGEVPFGCHDWDRYIDFWKPIFKELGYEI